MPDATDPVVTVIDNVYVRFSWNLPANNGSPVTAYNLYILKEDGFSLAESTSCDSSADPLIVTNRECLVPMSELTDPTLFALP